MAPARLGVPKETAQGETRVAATPETAGKLAKAGLAVAIERGAGEAAGFSDRAYAEAGAVIVADASALWAGSDVVLKVRELSAAEVALARPGSVVVGLLRPHECSEALARLAAREVNAFALERLPRTSRAQKMDVLSSMSTVAGYKAVLLAADRLPRFFPLLMTAAGTIPPARVFVLGAGVAGLSAIATARRLGALVEAFDVRPAVREEVESLGATFVSPADASGPAASSVAGAGGSGAYAEAQSRDEQARTEALLAPRVIQSDIVITTALVPGRAAPRLVSEATVRAMRAGAVIVDLAAEAGGNCALTRPDEVVVADGVTILGPTNITAGLPGHASLMYARNAAAFVQLLCPGGELKLDFADDLVRESCVTRAQGAAA
jgi:NAD(P) transhydrogenase subunit alpha